MSRIGTSSRGRGWVTAHARTYAEVTEPWKAQPTVCGKMRRDTMTQEAFARFEDGQFRTHKCAACTKVLAS